MKRHISTNDRCPLAGFLVASIWAIESITARLTNDERGILQCADTSSIRLSSWLLARNDTYRVFSKVRDFLVTRVVFLFFIFIAALVCWLADHSN